MVPQRARRPLPWSVVAGIAVHMAEQGHFAMSLAWLTMFDCYLRPGECLDLEVNQVLPSPGVDGMMQTALLLHPDERGIASKTGELNESVLLHKQRLGSLLSQWARHRRILKHSALWGFTLAQLRKQFLEASQAYCLQPWKPVLYMARHSGASWDRLNEVRPLNEVQRRGRWRSEATVRRYEKRALVQQVYLSLPAAQRKMAHRASTKVEELMVRLVARECGKTRATRASSLSSSSSFPAVKRSRKLAGGDV